MEDISATLDAESTNNTDTINNESMAIENGMETTTNEGESGTVEEPTTAKNNNENGEYQVSTPTSTPSQKKRYRTKDANLALSPDLNITGKRQRKINTMYMGKEFAIDKKTSHVFGQDEDSSTNPILPVVLDSPVVVNRKEALMSPAEAVQRTKKLPKGYAYVPVTEASRLSVSLPPPELPTKRERKKSNFQDFISPKEKTPEKPEKIPTKIEKVKIPKEKKEKVKKEKLPKKTSPKPLPPNDNNINNNE